MNTQKTNMGKSKESVSCNPVCLIVFIVICLMCMFVLGFSMCLSLKEVYQIQNQKSKDIIIEHEDLLKILSSLNNIDKMEKENTASIMKSLETLEKEGRQKVELSQIIIILLFIHAFGIAFFPLFQQAQSLFF